PIVTFNNYIHGSNGGKVLFIAIVPGHAESITKLTIYNIKLLVSNPYPVSSAILTDVNKGTTAERPNACPKGFIYEDTTLGITVINKGDSTTQNWVEIPIEKTESWTVTVGDVLTSSTTTVSKIGKQVALSGTFTFATADTEVNITLPYTPNYGGVYTIGDLTFTLTNNNNVAKVKSSTTGAKPFQLQYKTA